MEAPVYQRYSRAFKIASVSLHAISAAQFCFGCYYDWFHVIIPEDVMPIFSAFGYKMKFLTYWDALLQAAYFSLCLVNDVVDLSCKTDPNRSPLKRVKDFVYASFAFPIAMFVGATFWGLMAVDRELVLPAKLDPYFPPWINHILHTNIVICQLLETVTSDRQYPPFKFGIPALFVFQSCYISWMFVVHAKSGLWVYPIFDVLSTPLRIVFLGGCFVTGLLFYLAGYRINTLLWGNSHLMTQTWLKLSRDQIQSSSVFPDNQRKDQDTHPNVLYSRQEDGGREESGLNVIFVQETVGISGTSCSPILFH